MDALSLEVLLQAPTGKTVAAEAHPTRPLVAAVEKVIALRRPAS
jgi:hypothetical protein